MAMDEQLSRTENTHRSTPHTLWAAPLSVALTFLVVGCYTILKHPITADGEDAEQASHQEYYRGRCLDCHQDYATYPYGFFYGEYPDYYFEYPRWGQYYAYPWWWDRLWYENSDDGTSSGAAYPDSAGSLQDSRKASRRGGMVPPYVEGAPPVDYGGGGYRYDQTPSGGGGSGNQPGSGTTESGGSSTRLQDKASQQSPPTNTTGAGESTPRLREKSAPPPAGTAGTGKGTTETQVSNPQKPAEDSNTARPLETKSKKSGRRSPP